MKKNAFRVRKISIKKKPELKIKLNAIFKGKKAISYIIFSSWFIKHVKAIY